jgi:DNA ligase-1
VDLEALVATSRAVSDARSRLEKISLLAACLKQLSPGEIEPGVAFLSGELRQGKIGLGYAAVRDVASSSEGRGAGAPLSVLDVDAAFERIGRVTGTGASRQRAELLAELLSRATPGQRDFLKRLIVGELRQGALEGVLLEAVARAAGLPPANVRRAAMLEGDLRRIARLALTQGEAGLAELRLVVLRPVLPMLAQSAGDLAEQFEGASGVALEDKLDGARIQVHKDGADVRVFTRSLNDVTDRSPEIVERVRALPARSIVLDGETIALRPDGRPETFQNTMRRFGRRLDVERLRAELPLAPYFFDCLFVDGEPLFDRPLSERFAALSQNVDAAARVERTVVSDPRDAAAARAFFDAAVARGHEGVMAKSLDAPYEAGRRGAGWLKLKLTHTLDLVVLAAEWGSGRRRGFLSNLHLGARDPATSGFVMLGKTFKGMTDEMLRWQTERLSSLEISRDAYTVYVRPELVVEVAFDGVQVSSQYPGGVALRFARIKRYRTDKTVLEADTIETVRAILARGATPE